MFQNAWYDPKADNIIAEKLPAPPAGFITSNRIRQVAVLYWDEHCLECSAPACYASCPKYVPRTDKLCKRLFYGIRHDRPVAGLLWNVSVHFREWGKLEARINRGTLSPKDVKKLDARDRAKTRVFKLASLILSPSDRNISRQWDGLKRKKYAGLPAKTPFASDFLFQCFSYEEEPFRMNFEITDARNRVIFKTGFTIKPGFHQEFLKLELIPPENGLVRFFPENNREARLSIFAADFVELADAIPSDAAKKIKCIAWDLDRTVWNGILAESEADALSLRSGVLETIRELDRRGIIQIVVSKNDFGSVEPILEKLGIRQYFVYVLANWNSKSVNLHLAARMLNIGVDSFGLIDDSDFERREVSETLPCVRVYREDLSSFLEHGELQAEITSESLHRRESYLQEASRKAVLSNDFSGNNTDFIRNCKMEITVKRIETEEEKTRSCELLQRTNQLNLSGYKYTREEFSTLLGDGKETVIVFVKDRYGDYGQVGFVHFEAGDRIRISEFAMSCRVASKFVEAALFRQIKARYKKDLWMDGKKTARNGTLAAVLEQCGFENRSEDPAKICMCSPAKDEIPFSDINAVRWQV